jgi:hypothetical protein
MKKTILSFSTAILLGMAFTGCQQGNVAEMQKQDSEKVTSKVQVKIDELNAQLDEECTKLIADEAQAMVDAMPVSKTKTTNTKTTTTKSTTKPAKPTTSSSKWDDKTTKPGATTSTSKWDDKTAKPGATTSKSKWE